MSNRKYLLKAMLQHIGYSSTLDSAKLDKIIEKFKIDINARPDALASQVNKLVKKPEFNNHMNELHKQEYGPNAPKPSNFRPLPQLTPSSSNQGAQEDEDLEYKYRNILKPKTPRPSPYGTQ